MSSTAPVSSSGTEVTAALASAEEAEAAEQTGSIVAQAAPVVAAGKPRASDAGPLPIYGFEWRKHGRTLIAYLLDSEVHTFAFSVSANAILSFIPFIVLLYTLARSLFHSQQMIDVIGDMVTYLLPADTTNKDWVAVHLAAMAPHKTVRVFSLLVILVSCTGIFLPLEVALNRSWGVAKSRNYLWNQLVALGLALWMLLLGLASIFVNSGQRWALTKIFFGHTDNFAFQALTQSCLAISTAVAGILMFFAIYWLLPNRKLPWRPVMRVSILVGLLWVGAKYLFVAVLPRLDLHALYGPFSVSVGLLLWAYVSGLLLFAGAQFSAMRYKSTSSLAVERA